MTSAPGIGPDMAGFWSSPWTYTALKWNIIWLVACFGTCLAPMILGVKAWPDVPEWDPEEYKI